MSLLASVRRYGGPTLLFAFCLMTVLFVSSETAATLALPAISATPTSKTKTDMKQSAAAMPANLTQGVRKTVLENGLTVLTKELHTAPVVSVQVWYRVGSQDESVGLNGISHLLEHLMFKG